MRQSCVALRNNVCAVSQYQLLVCVPGISEAILLPVLVMLLLMAIDKFPFQNEGFNSDTKTPSNPNRMQATRMDVLTKQVPHHEIH